MLHCFNHLSLLFEIAEVVRLHALYCCCSKINAPLICPSHTECLCTLYVAVTCVNGCTAKYAQFFYWIPCIVGMLYMLSLPQCNDLNPSPYPGLLSGLIEQCLHVH